MTDVEAVVQKYLVGVAGIRILAGNRVYAGRYLPSGYSVTKGAAILFAPRGGGQDYSSKLFTPSMQFRCYAETERDARKLSQALYDALNDHTGNGIKFARMDEGTFPTLLTEPDTNWPYALSYYRIYITNNGG